MGYLSDYEYPRRWAGFDRATPFLLHAPSYMSDLLLERADAPPD